MKNNIGLNSILSMFLIVFTSLMMVSCGDDEENTDVSGCTDTAADNYNAAATVDDGSCVYSGCTDMDAENFDPNATNDDGSCVYARDKFIGSYVGMFTCPGALAIIGSDSLVFTIEPSLDASNKNGVLLNLTLASVPVPIALEGTVSGETLSIESTLTGITIPNLPIIGTIVGDVNGSGDATIVGGILTSTVSVTITSPALAPIGGSISDSCTLVGTKQ